MKGCPSIKHHAAEYANTIYSMNLKFVVTGELSDIYLLFYLYLMLMVDIYIYI